MTRAELKEAFLANNYLISLSNTMDYIKDPNSEPKPEAAFDKMMVMVFQDTTLTEGYIEQMNNNDFSAVIIDDRFGVYLRNCLREDLGATLEP